MCNGMRATLDDYPCKQSWEGVVTRPAKRPSLKAERSCLGTRPSARSAHSNPLTGPRQNPWPEKPAAITRPDGVPGASITGSASGVISIRPPQARAIGAAAAIGSTWATRSTTLRISDVDGASDLSGHSEGSPGQAPAPLLKRKRPSASCRPAQSALATPNTGRRQIGNGLD